jgi:transcription antitermination factor NusG
MDDQKWFVVYTKPRNEKQVHGLLLDLGYESYCPVNKTRRKWSDRYKIVEEPLFRSYVFVKLCEHQTFDVLKIEGVVRFLYWNRKPATVREAEIELIKRFLGENASVQVEYIDFKKDQTVAFIASNFLGQQAKVLEVRNRQVKVLIESMGCYLVAVVDKSKLEISKN